MKGEKVMQYEEPYMQIIKLEKMDIITESPSTVTNKGDGDGNEYNANNWF